ncbi:Protein of unknown function [Halobacillus karajensis]|uniref:DUF3231 family protein n=1 Tax=Halobacillus karajensis TaxID=195088 RepID=A0A059NXP4_9BACI|nr:DUF3231 family protein [Halobacillus karajensis]CDQ18400.1 hypothetical protein BN982_00670 [Halobacillus karajensis]CDQ23528.1 hypothetical protein BN983_01758 [Halobacillus karajensis]CDQ27010.1 hypothetical protein BN981_01238 [Halobacillus karajensis]SEH51920.1 Protein of unknown function [Halobacillus karajensis]
MSQRILTANEIGLLWTQYIQNSMAIPLLEYFKVTSEDEEIQSLIALAREIADYGVQECGGFLEGAGHPIPNGYSMDDLNPNAKKLFTDAFILTFLGHMAKAGLTSEAYSLGASAREDVRQFFSIRIQKQEALYNHCVHIGFEKNIYTMSPQIAVEDEIEYVESKKYYHPFSKRSLNAVEITHIFENIKNNTVGEMICQGFAQTTKNKTIKEFMSQGKKMSGKHRKVFANFLEQSGIIPPMNSSNMLTTNTDPVFSDRLMMYVISVLASSGQGNYTTGASVSLRYDLIFTYHKLTLDAAVYSKDGLDIMIHNGWFEEPPQAPDRHKLIQ